MLFLCVFSSRYKLCRLSPSNMKFVDFCGFSFISKPLFSSNTGILSESSLSIFSSWFSQTSPYFFLFSSVSMSFSVVKSSGFSCSFDLIIFILFSIFSRFSFDRFVLIFLPPIVLFFVVMVSHYYSFNKSISLKITTLFFIKKDMCVPTHISTSFCLFNYFLKFIYL